MLKIEHCIHPAQLTTQFKQELSGVIKKNPFWLQRLTNKFENCTAKLQASVEEIGLEPEEKSLFLIYLIVSVAQYQLEQTQANITLPSDPQYCESCMAKMPIEGPGGLKDWLCAAWGIEYP